MFLFFFSESTTYKFGLNRGIIIFEHFEDDRKDTTSDTLAFGFKTIQHFAVLARIDSADTNDFIEMELVCIRKLNSQTFLKRSL